MSFRKKNIFAHINRTNKTPKSVIRLQKRLKIRINIMCSFYFGLTKIKKHQTCLK